MEIKNKRVFLRADFNVPIQGGIVKDDYRIKTTIDTLKILKDGNNKTLLVSHIETKDIEKSTLKPVFEYLKNNFTDFTFHFLENVGCLDDIKNAFEGVKEGEFLLLENIRNLSGEKDNDIELANFFHSITDFYINDAFAVSHRNHMSVSALPKIFTRENKMFGVQMQKEIDNLSKIINPNTPVAVILSGAKFSTKLPLIQKYLNTADNIFIGGALYNNILKSLGYNVGSSLIDKDASYIDEMIKTDNFKNKVYISEYVVVKDINTGEIKIKNIKEVLESETIQDIDNQSVYEFINTIKNKNAQTIIWNGPLGNYEIDDFKKGTRFLAEELIKFVNESSASLYIGGGDTVASINDMNIVNNKIFVSTGGGAMLEFLEKDGKIPGVVNVTM